MGEFAVKGLPERKPGLVRDLAERRTSFAERKSLGTQAEWTFQLQDPQKHQ